MPNSKTRILTQGQIEAKIVRMAHHIYENHYKAKELHFVGIHERGFQLAERLTKILAEISSIKIYTYDLKIDKDKPMSEPEFSGDMKALKGKMVFIVDDVLNSGRTLMHACRYVLENNPHGLATVTLVDRIHRRFPIHADYVGLTLSTNLKEHVSVDLRKGKEVAYLE